MTWLTAANAHLDRLRQHIAAASAAECASELRLDAHAHLSNAVDRIRRTPALTGAELSARLALTSFLTHLERASPPCQIESHRRLTLDALDGLTSFLAPPDRLGNPHAVRDFRR